jgi:hypothetical protein
MPPRPNGPPIAMQQKTPGGSPTSGRYAPPQHPGPMVQQQGIRLAPVRQSQALVQRQRGLPATTLRSNTMTGTLANSSLLRPRLMAATATTGLLAYSPRPPTGTRIVESSLRSGFSGHSGMAEAFNSVAPSRLKASEITKGSINPFFNSASFGRDGYRAILVARSSNANKIVLGKYPIYLGVASASGSKRFQIPVPIWKKMSDERKRAANRTFLDRAVARNSKIILSSDPRRPENQIGALQEEIDYLRNKGYVISETGREMVKK